MHVHHVMSIAWGQRVALPPQSMHVLGRLNAGNLSQSELYQQQTKLV